MSAVAGLPWLPLDVWRKVWDNLPIWELAVVASVTKEWRDEAIECAAEKRAKAVSLVTAPKAAPDPELTLPQLVHRCFQRLLLRQNPFSGDSLHLPFPQDTVTDIMDISSSDGNGQMIATYDRLGDGGECRHSLAATFHRNGPGRDHEVRILIQWMRDNDAPHVYKCKAVCIKLRPALDDWVWMEGLLLALTGGSQGLLRDGRPSSMPCELAHCTRFRVMWLNVKRIRCHAKRSALGQQDLWPTSSGHLAYKTLQQEWYPTYMVQEFMEYDSDELGDDEED